MRVIITSLAAALMLCLSAPAQAQAPTEEDRATALSLFKEGRERVKAGDRASACPKFDAAFKLWASASTLINIAQCHEHDGRVASAWSAYQRSVVLNRETVGAARQEALAKIAAAGVQRMEARLPRLRIDVIAPTPPPSGLVVMRDGAPYPNAGLRSALPVDPGSSQVRVTAPGHEPFSAKVTLVEGEISTVSVTLTPLAPAVAPPPPPLVTAPVPPLVPTPAPPQPDADSGDGIGWWAWASGATGLVFAGVSIGFLIDDLDAIDALRENCFDEGSETVCYDDYDFAADNDRKNRSGALFAGFGIGSLALLTVATVGIVGGMSDDGAVAFTPIVTPELTAASLAIQF